MKQRMDWGTFHLTPEDVKSFLAGDESANAIGRRKGGSSSLVTYHLRKLNDPKINEMLQLNANRASADFKNNRKDKVIELIRAGRSTNSIVEEVGTSTSTVTKVRRELGLSGPARPKKIKPSSNSFTDFTLRNVVNSLVGDVRNSPHFVALTKKWPVNINLAM